jgi:hypothetical protein
MPESVSMENEQAKEKLTNSDEMENENEEEGWLMEMDLVILIKL